MEGPGQDAGGDGDIQIEGDGIVASNISGSILTTGNVNLNNVTFNDFPSTKILEGLLREIQTLNDQLGSRDKDRSEAETDLIKGSRAISSGDLGAVAVRCEKAMKFYESDNDEHGKLKCSILFAYLQSLVSSSNDDYDRLGRNLDEILRQSKELEAFDIQCSALAIMGNIAEIQGKGKLAEKRYSECLSMATTQEDEVREAATLGSLGNIWMHMGKVGKAESAFQRSMKINTKIGNKGGEGGAAGGLSKIAKRQGNDELALEFAEKSLECAIHEGNKWTENGAVSQIGLVLLAMNKKEEAKDYFVRSRRMNIELKNSRGEAYSLLNLSRCGIDLIDLDETERYAKLALELFQNLGDPNGVVSCCITLGKIARNRNQLFRAISFFEEGVESSVDLKNPSLKATLWSELGRCQVKNHQYPEAEESFENALKIAKKDSNRKLMAMIWGNKKNLEKRQNNLTMAEEIIKSISEKKRFEPLVQEEIDIIRNLATHEFAMGHNLLRMGMKTPVSTSYFVEAESHFRRYVRICNVLQEPLDDWMVSNNFSNSNEEWDFPPQGSLLESL